MFDDRVRYSLAALSLSMFQTKGDNGALHTAVLSGDEMQNKLRHVISNFAGQEDAQDLVEYALVVALIAFGAIAGMQFLAGGVNNAFSELAAVVTSNIS